MVIIKIGRALKIDLIEPSDFRKIAAYLKVHAQPKDSIRN